MKRYIGNTGEVYVLDDDMVRKPVADDEPVRVEKAAPAVFARSLGKSRKSVPANLPFDLDAGDIAILALLFFLYRESGDEEFLIILAFFAFGILSK